MSKAAPARVAPVGPRMFTLVPRHLIVITRPKFDEDGKPVMKGDKQAADRFVAEPKMPFKFTEQEARDIMDRHGKAALAPVTGPILDSEIVSDPNGPQPADPEADAGDDKLPGDDDL